MRSTSLVSFLVALGLASTAFAAAPHPTAADADGDGAYTATMDVNGDSNLDHEDIGVRASQYDCDDVHSTVSPKLTEIVGDGIDNDCSGADAVYPVADPVAARYLANSGTSSPLAFISEYGRCSTATECDVDDVAGTMKINAAAAETHVFRDIYKGVTKVLGTDGIREVVTVEEASHFRGSGSGSGGVGKSYVDRSAGVLIAADAKEREERLAADAAHDSRIGALESDRDAIVDAVNDHTRSIDALEGALALQADALDSETRARREADTALSGRITAAESNASSAVTTANRAQSHGPLFEGYAIGGLGFGQVVSDNGDVARNPVLGGGGAGANVGVDGDGFRANAYGQVMFGSDGSDGPANMWNAGGEYLWEVADSDVHLGFQLGYAQRSSLVNALETQVLGRLPNAGPSLAIPFAYGDSGQHGVFVVRTGFGPEMIGMSGDSVTSSTRFGGFVTLGIGGGVGALKP